MAKRENNEMNHALGHLCAPISFGLRRSEVLHVDGEETFLLLSNRRDREPNPEL